MADFNVSDVASKINAPQQVSIGDMLNIARGAQAYKQANEINPLLLQEAQQKVKQSTAEANVSEKTQEPRISRSISEAEQQRIAAEKAGIDINQIYEDTKSRTFGGLLANPAFNPESPNKEEMKTALSSAHELLKSLKIPTGVDDVKQIHEQVEKNPLAVIQGIKDRSYQRQTTTEQAIQLNAPPVQVANGQGTNLIRTSPMQQGMPSQFVQTLPSPTTTYVATAKDDPELTPGTSFIKLANGEKRITGQAPLDTAQQGEVAHDMAVVNQLAQGAQSRIGLYQGLKDLSKTALVGPAADKRKLAIEVGALFGLNLDQKTIGSMNDTALFQKESAMLGQLPGGTDAANLVNQMANPNFKMMPESIREAADLGIAREKLNLLGQKIKSQYAKDPNGYYSAMKNFNDISDPRAYNFIELAKPEQARIFNSLSVDSKGNPLPKGKDGRTNPQREFIAKTNKIIDLRNKYEQ
jgi:hypothetical protein